MKNFFPKKLIAALTALIILALPVLSLPATAEIDTPTINQQGEDYETIYNALTECKTTVNVYKYNLTPNDVQKMLTDMFCREAELFFVKRSYELEWDSNGIVRLLRFSYNMTGSKLAETKEKYNVLMNELYSLGSKEWSDLETALFYHDYLAAHYSYDLSYTNYDAFSFLEEKTGVCQAYALVYQDLMNYFDVPCTYVRSSNLNHIWNVLYIDGAWYHTDVTNDDPIYDRPNKADHRYFLIGSEKNQFLRSNTGVIPGDLSDMSFGEKITVSKEDHPYKNLWINSNAAFTEINGNFFGIIQNENKTEANLALMDFDTGTLTSIAALSAKWYLPNSRSYYRGNYSSLCSDGRYLYYHDDDEVFRFDPCNKNNTVITRCNSTTKIYGLSIENNKLIMHNSTNPNSIPVKNVTKIELPTYYTINWFINNVAVQMSYVKEGELPNFEGSTDRQAENGYSYTFIGWSPEVVIATKDAVYVAQYSTTEILPDISDGSDSSNAPDDTSTSDSTPLDVNRDGSISISDVTALLNRLSSSAIYEKAFDVNEDGFVTISDTTYLLNCLSNATY